MHTPVSNLGSEIVHARAPGAAGGVPPLQRPERRHSCPTHQRHSWRHSAALPWDQKQARTQGRRVPEPVATAQLARLRSRLRSHRAADPLTLALTCAWGSEGLKWEAVAWDPGYLLQVTPESRPLASCCLWRLLMPLAAAECGCGLTPHPTVASKPRRQRRASDFLVYEEDERVLVCVTHQVMYV